MKIDVVNSTVAPVKPGQQLAVSVNVISVTDTKTAKSVVSPNLAKAVDKLNKEAETLNREVRFAIYTGTHRIMIEVVDKQTNQVVATFPPKQILQMAAAIDQETTDNNKTDNKAVK